MTSAKKPIILIAEDDEQFRALLERFLHQKYEVVIASDGEEALQLARTKNPVLILTDILMPKKTGVELLRDLKSKKDTKDIPVVILLATASVADLNAARSLKAEGILPKEDITRQTLFDVVARYAQVKSK